MEIVLFTLQTNLFPILRMLMLNMVIKLNCTAGYWLREHDVDRMSEYLILSGHDIKLYKFRSR